MLCNTERAALLKQVMKNAASYNSVHTRFHVNLGSFLLTQMLAGP